jgi:hypothetical protein
VVAAVPAEEESRRGDRSGLQQFGAGYPAPTRIGSVHQRSFRINCGFPAERIPRILPYLFAKSFETMIAGERSRRL